MIRVSVVFDGVRVEPGEPGLDAGGLERAARAALAHAGADRFELSIAVVSDAALAELHERYLGDPSETDVMSFDLSDDLDGPAGEVVLSLDRARAVARRRGLALGREMALYAVHGTLHLVGYDDLEPAARERMREAERQVLLALGYRAEGGTHELEDGELEHDPQDGER